MESQGCIAIAKQNHTAASPWPYGITQLHCHSQTKSHSCIAMAKWNHTAALPWPNGITRLHCHGQMESQGCIATAKQNHKTVLTWLNWSTWKFGQCHWLDERAKWRWETVSAVCVRVLRSWLEKGTVQTTDYWHSKQKKTRKYNHISWHFQNRREYYTSWVMKNNKKLQKRQTWRYILCKYYVVYDWKVMAKPGMSEK